MAAAVSGWVAVAALLVGGAAAAATTAPVGLDPGGGGSGPGGSGGAHVRTVVQAPPVETPSLITPELDTPPLGPPPVDQLPLEIPRAGTATGSVTLPGRVPPRPGPPVRPFEAPAHEYGPGHRGVDLSAAAGDPVVAPADGVVTFAGPVAGRGVVVVTHAEGTRTSLEPVRAVVARGSPVRRGEVVAVVAEEPVHAGCPTTRTPRCVHWGVRVGDRYVDPWWWLGVTGRVRLLPLSDP